MNLFFMFFPNPRTIKPRIRAQSNPGQCKISYKIPILHRNLQNIKKSSNPNPHEKTNPEKSSKFQPRRCQTQKPPTQNMNFILHVFLQIKTNPLKINRSTKNPYQQTETTTNNQNNHHNHPHHQP